MGSFRIESFEQFRRNFNDGVNQKISLLFNAIDPVTNPQALNWVLKYVTYSYGVKGSGFVRGHHLSGELSFKNQWVPYLLNPRGLQLFSAAEMDQSWQNPLYQINLLLGFYWGAINGLNTGLSIWEVTESALIEAQNTPELHDVFRFFNRHAGQIYPRTANAAFSFFHEGLNTDNTTKFPTAIYGRGVGNRSIAICKAYSDRGAQMDDILAAINGQVYQRESQTGYDDALDDIEEGNYERWITQIQPESTSIGLFRVRGPINKNSSKYDRFARSFQNSTGRNAMYFKFHDELFANNDLDALKFKITWLDKTPKSTWSFKYYSLSGVKTALNIKGAGDNQWKSVNVTINDAVVSKAGPMGSDFFLQNTDNIDDIFHGIELWIARK